MYVIKSIREMLPGFIISILAAIVMNMELLFLKSNYSVIEVLCNQMLDITQYLEKHYFLGTWNLLFISFLVCAFLGCSVKKTQNAYVSVRSNQNPKWFLKLWKRIGLAVFAFVSGYLMTLFAMSIYYTRSNGLVLGESWGTKICICLLCMFYMFFSAVLICNIIAMILNEKIAYISTVSLLVVFNYITAQTPDDILTTPFSVINPILSFSMIEDKIDSIRIVIVCVCLAVEFLVAAKVTGVRYRKNRRVKYESNSNSSIIEEI